PTRPPSYFPGRPGPPRFPSSPRSHRVPEAERWSPCWRPSGCGCPAFLDLRPTRAGGGRKAGAGLPGGGAYRGCGLARPAPPRRLIRTRGAAGSDSRPEPDWLAGRAAAAGAALAPPRAAAEQSGRWAPPWVPGASREGAGRLCARRGGPPEDIDPKDSYLITRSIMAEPDYIEDDNPELIRPQKLINPVKTSRNHQDLHRELLMNQKRGLAPQNKPELQKVMEKRKRDQVIKQKEEEAQKKKSDLEIELLKRQQKLEQLELEKQKLQEEQENAPEFVKVKGNLRRTGQEVVQAQES
uniref:Family with sequence similarity 107 member B n=1 Tax=Piliocolobus tephrosceles TaxID=591936 RepID=A0A8C9I3B6_9PRIM